MGGTKWSSGLQVISYVSSLRLGVERKVVLLSFLSFDLDVDVLEVIDGQRLALVSVEHLLSLSLDLFVPSHSLSLSGLVLLGVDSSQQLIIGLVDIQLHWMLIVGEESIVSISQVSEGSSLKWLKRNNQ